MDVLCSNLYINYIICKRKSWKIPDNLFCLIFEYFMEFKYPICKEDLDFFNRNHECINKLELRKRHIKFLNIYVHLNVKNLKILKIHQSRVNDIDVEYISKIIKNCSKLEELFIKRCRILPKVSEIVKALMNSSSTLKSISIPISYINKDLSKKLRNLLINCSKLEKFELSNPHLEGGENFSSLFQSVSSCAKTLRKLSFNGYGIDENISKLVKNVFKECYLLEEVDLSYNYDIDLTVICAGLICSAETLKSIKLANCIMKEEVCFDIGSLLRKCSKIEMIDLSLNRDIQNGLKEICTGLGQSSNTLKSLNIQFIDLKENQCSYLANLLKRCCSIEEILFSSNTQMESGILDIMNCLIGSVNTLKVLDFTNCELNITYCKSLETLLSNCPKIEQIFIAHNRLMGNGLSFTLNGLNSSKSYLNTIDLSNNDLNEILSRELGKFLMSCSHIEEIWLGNNPNMGNGFSEICEGLSYSKDYLKAICLLDCRLNENQCIELSKLLAKCYLIETFLLNWTNLMGEGLNQICQNLTNSSKVLRKIIKYFEGLDERSMNYLKNLIKNCPKHPEY